MSLKRVLAIHDISGVGKCSLTVALPVISACGIECSVLPTAVLSTHTGGFTGYTFRDLTDDILPIAAHWEKEGISFDAVYTGYLGSKEQLSMIKDICVRERQKGAQIIVDPVMADYGSLYPGFPDDFPQGMRELCEAADIILPNMTEACLMLGIDYEAPPYTKDHIEYVLKLLAAIPKKAAVLTGVDLDDGRLGAASIDIASGRIEYVSAVKIEGSYHGTGDVFASVFTGKYISGAGIKAALQSAADLTSNAAARTLKAGTGLRFGVEFEPELYTLIS